MAGVEEDREHWSRVAGEWTAWARTPNHDAFWVYRGSLAAFIGGGVGEALEVGCGEGRVSRELIALGYRVTATDAVGRMVERSRPMRMLLRRRAGCRSGMGASISPWRTTC